MEGEIATHYGILAWEFRRQRRPAGYSPWGHKESDMTEHLNKSNKMSLLILKLTLLLFIIYDKSFPYLFTVKNEDFERQKVDKWCPVPAQACRTGKMGTLKLARRGGKDGGGIGREDHVLPHKFLKRTFQRRANSTKQLL